MAVGAVISMVGAKQKANADAAAADYNAQIADQNAGIAEQQGEAAAQAQDRDARMKMGSMVAGYGASGVDGGSGSPMDVLAQSARMATLDNLTTKYNYHLKALGYSNQAGLDSSNAKNSTTAGNMNALSAGVRGLGSSIPSFGGGGSRGMGSNSGSASYGAGVDASSVQA